MLCVLILWLTWGTSFSRRTFELLPSQQCQLTIRLLVFPPDTGPRPPTPKPSNSPSLIIWGWHKSTAEDIFKYSLVQKSTPLIPVKISLNPESHALVALLNVVFFGFCYKCTRWLWYSYRHLLASNPAERLPLAACSILITSLEKVFPPTIFQNSHFLSITDVLLGLCDETSQSYLAVLVPLNGLKNSLIKF